MNELKPNFEKRLIKFILKVLFATFTLASLFLFLWIATPN